MKKVPAAIHWAEAGSHRETFRRETIPLLTVEARWPRLEETAPGLRRIDRYYDALADRWLRRWSGPLLDRARRALDAGGEEAASLPWTARLDFTVTLFRPDLLSLYLDAEEDTGGRRPSRVRQGDVWLLPAGVPVTLRELLPRRRWWRGPVLEEVRRQAGALLRTGESVFYQDWVSLLSKHLSPRRFYLTEEGIALFYPPETVAPAMEGFPTFLLPTQALGEGETGANAEKQAPTPTF